MNVKVKWKIKKDVEIKEYKYCILVHHFINMKR